MTSAMHRSAYPLINTFTHVRQRIYLPIAPITQPHVATHPAVRQPHLGLTMLLVLRLMAWSLGVQLW